MKKSRSIRRPQAGPASILQEARRVLRVEADAVRSLVPRVGPSFAAAVETLYACKGRVVVTGIGKSGTIGRKIMATLASTGTPALFLHAVEALHGDLGMVTKEDVILVVSYSGETAELAVLLPAFRRMGAPLIAMTGNPKSTLARHADIVLDVRVKKEACPMNLAPTASTTATLALGDALAVALFKLRGFTPKDFARVHPSGALGKKLLTRVADLMHTGNAVPQIRIDATMREAIVEISAKRLGFTAVVDPDGRAVGIVTDGDLRRHLQLDGNFLDTPAGRMCTPSPKSISKDALATEALAVMEKNSITSLLILDDRRRLFGCIHVHDILKSGVA